MTYKWTATEKKKIIKPKARKIKPKPKENKPKPIKSTTVHYCRPNSSSPEYHKTHPIMIDDVRTNKIDLWYALANGKFLHVWMKVDNKKYKSKELTPKAKRSGVRSQLHMDIYDELPRYVLLNPNSLLMHGEKNYKNLR